MMSSKPTPRFMDPVAHAKLPRLETTLGAKSGDMPGYSHEEPVNYSGTYFSYCLSGPDRTDLSPHWSPPGACLQRSPIVHPTGAGRPLSGQITHRPENMAHCVEGSPHSATRDLAANQQSSYYDRVPENQGPSAPGIHAPTAVRKLGVGGATVSPSRGSPVGLAIPKPIYGHNPCCTEHGCTSGPCYSMERGAPRVHPNAYNEEWMLHYGPLSLLQRKEREALLQLEQSSVRFPLRETTPEGYHAMRPARPMRFPSFMEANYGNFPYTSTARSPLSPSSDLFHRLQFPSKVYHSLPPPPSCTYEEVQQMALTHPGITPKIYPDRPPPAPRYTQLPQRPVFYYSQGNMELENPSPYKSSSRNLAADPPPTVSKQVSPNPLGPCLGPQPSLSDFSASCPATTMNPLFPRNRDLSHFQMYRAHAGMTGQKRAFAEGPGAPLLVRHADRPVDYSSQGAWVTSSPRELCKRPLSPGAFNPVQQSLPTTGARITCLWESAKYLGITVWKMSSQASKQQLLSAVWTTTREEQWQALGLLSTAAVWNAPHPSVHRCEGEHQGFKETKFKEEEAEKVTSSSDSVLDLRVKRGEFNMFASEVQTSMDQLSSTGCGADTANRHPTPEPKPPGDANRQARHRFMEIHQSLFRLISASVSRAPEQELQAWLANLEAASSPTKAVPVTGLLGAGAKEPWLRCRDTAAALSQVAGQLEDYAANRQCPFPHVIRAGALFIPMLVVKEYLFPQVLGALIDRVLQEHHVELRPTTLSEERHLTQLQRRTCSSKLRRLLSLKHLPDIYPDVLNLYYHACVSKRLDSTSPAGAQKTAQV
ncbi:hypothetical protein ANANG_G00206010 [Anguilla anguilla]|uniref:Uncharacterized protein n=1 Tax=Anguilla anguilla TaxID=7936 RepID=A0A9D3LYX4_ANGAN|nr:hypothetical protein ANANG_G00206010 [Anguilla anguilla]